MLKAGTLPYALLLSVIIALMSSSLILLSYYNRIQIKNSEIQEQVIRNSKSGFHVLLVEGIIPNNTIKTIDLFEQGNDSVELKRKSWGVFECINSKATIGKFTNSKAAIIGKELTEMNATALYLPSYNKPLSLCGKTILKGQVFIPKAGVKRAYIEGQNYIGNKLIYGTEKTSEKELPKLNADIKNQIQNLLKFNYSDSDSDSLVNWAEIKNSNIHQKFSDKTLVLYSKEKIQLGAVNFSGNIIIASKTGIEVSNNSKIASCILVAPNIVVNDYFKGSVQLVADASVEIGENVILNYPSSIALINDSDNEAKTIVIHENAKIYGVVINYGNNSDINSIQIEEKSTIYGQVYCSNVTSLKGAVYGSVFTSSFILKTPSSIYQNHLLNAVIDYTKLPVQFVGIDLIKSNNPKKVIQWVN